MLILDTDILTIIQLRHGELYTRITARLEPYAPDVAVTVISFEEQLRGWLALIAKSKPAARQIIAYRRLLDLLDDFRVRPDVGFDSAAAKTFDDLRRAHRRAGTMDLKIAAIALANRATLATRNRRDFEHISDLKLLDLIGEGA